MTTRQAKVVSSYKGLDQEIFVNIDPHKRERFFNQLAKELYIIAETAQKGAGEKLELLIRKYLENKLSFSEIRHEMNSLVEIGKNFDTLDEALKKIVHRAEIQQEFYHFSRIMGHDRILKKADEVNEEELMNEVRDFARFLVLVLERRAERGIELKILPIYHGKELEGNISIDNDRVIMKNRKLNVHAIISVCGDSNQDHENAKTLLIVFEKLLAKYSFDVSCALLDYYCFLKPGYDQYSFFASQEYQELKKRKLRIFNVGSNTCLILTQPENGEFFEKEVTAIINNKSFDKQKLGQSQGINFGMDEIELPSRGSCVVIMKSIELSKTKLNKDINRKDNKGKVHSLNNLSKTISSTPVLFNIGHAAEIEKFKWNEERIRKGMEKVDLSSVTKMNQVVNVEAGHIHADRRLGQVQIDGLNIAAKLVESLKRQNIKKVENVAMVDEYHVVNSLDYQDYLNKLSERKFEVKELVYESSPLILEIALDVLKKVIRDENKQNKYEIIYEGDSVYLRFAEGGSVIEMIENVDGNFSLGCVLFEVGLCLYKRYDQKMTKLFRKLHNLSANYNLHREMTKIYLENKTSSKRDKEIKKNTPQIISNFKSVKSDLSHTPYLRMIDKAKAGSESKVLVNVLEDFYQPQQRKLNKILNLIDQQGIFSLYFNNNQEIYLKKP